MISLVLSIAFVLFGFSKLVSYLRIWTESGKLGYDLPRVYPHYDPIWGIDLTVRAWIEFHNGQLSEGLRKRHESLGHTFMTRNLGGDCIYTVDPDNIRTVTTHNFKHYGKSAWVQEASKHVGAGVLMNEGDMWKHSRALLKPIFARNALDEVSLTEPHVQNLIQAIRGTHGKCFDFQDLAASFSLDLVTDFLFGKPALALSDGQDSHEAKNFLSLVKKFEGPSASFIAVGVIAWLELIPSYRQLLHTVRGMKTFFKEHLDAIISDSGYRADNTGTSCFRMMKSAGVPPNQIQAELQNIFFASFDTTTALLANIMDVLSSRQDVQRKLREEVVCLKGIPAKEDLGKMEYLRFVLLEALRLRTPVASHSRQANEDTVLPKGGGEDGQNPILVRAGTTIVWSIYSLNRSSRFYGNDWAEFRPERWQELQRNSSSFFMPFGSGPRSCMGQHMAYVEIAYVIVRLLQSFPVITNVDLRPFKEAKAVSYYNGYGTKVSLH